MSPIEVRPFRRSDRDQLTQLVNAHAAAVCRHERCRSALSCPRWNGSRASSSKIPWVSERVTLVADQRDRIAAAAHLLRHFPDERAGKSARGVGEIHWLLFWPVAPAGNPFWPDATEAAEALMAACIRQLRSGGDAPACGRRAARARRLRGA